MILGDDAVDRNIFGKAGGLAGCCCRRFDPRSRHFLLFLSSLLLLFLFLSSPLLLFLSSLLLLFPSSLLLPFLSSLSKI